MAEEQMKGIAFPHRGWAIPFVIQDNPPNLTDSGDKYFKSTLDEVRYADVLLGLAEALCQQDGKWTEALLYVNMVRNRAGVAALNTNEYTMVANAEDLMKRIRDELDNGTFTEFKNKYVDLLDTRI